ncbi:MAG: adenylate/guanylate cyclase domain-containing protein [Alphaproteobacteria bacterium]
MLRRIRLISGSVLFAYIFLHMIPLIAGNVSLGAMEGLRPYIQGGWETWPGLAVLYLAMTTHMALGFYAIYKRRRWRGIRMMELVQLATGVSVPMLLSLHLVSTRIAAAGWGLSPTYDWILAIYFEYDVMAGARQAAVLVVAWTHGCIGLYQFLRLKRAWGKCGAYAFAFALIWPILALTGMVHAGREAAARTIDPGWVEMVLADVGNLDRETQAMLYRVEDGVILLVLGFLGMTFAARFVRAWLERRRGIVTLRYDDGVETKFNHGLTLLDASRDCGYPHASVCGGRGRCSTCRVRVRHGTDLLEPPSSSEQAVLDRVKAGPDVRLACQCVPKPGAIAITTLLPPTATAARGYAASDMNQGKEKTIAVMFCDLRGFTTVSEDKLPYDIVFLLNRYFDAMGKAIEESGGHIDKFIGDGIMALFGLNSTPEVACRQACMAARRMSERLKDLNRGLAEDLDRPLRIGIGIHVGSVIIGEMGYSRATQLTAIGDTVNTASRLEAKTKDYGAELVVSKDVLSLASIELAGLDCASHDAEVRGRTKPIEIYAFADAGILPDGGRSDAA